MRQTKPLNAHSLLAKRVATRFHIRCTMATKQEWLRELIVQFARNHTKAETVKQFAALEIPRSTVYGVLSTFEARKSTERQRGSGRPACIMTQKRKKSLDKTVNRNPELTGTQLAKKYKCSRRHLQTTLKEMGFNCYHREKAPKYTPEQIMLVKRHSRWMHDRYKTEIFVLDDEKYFGLSGPVNGMYYARSRESVPDEVRYVQREKYEKKVLMYLAVSERGISEMLLTESRIAVNQQTYTEQCLRRILLPFLQKYHADGNYVFWPDKASSHYARMAMHFMASNGINLVPKEHNPTNLPQCRPIEDLWGYLVDIVYANGWHAKDVKQLQRRIRWAMKQLDLESVRRSFSEIRSKLRVVYRDGPYAANH